MENIFIVAILFALIGAAAGYVIKAKRAGQKCIGCPHAKGCVTQGKCGCGQE